MGSTSSVVIRWVTLADIRSYRALKWHPDPNVNLLVGPNGAGKTNLMEAIGYLPSLRSFRGVPDDGLISYEADSGVIRAGLGWGDNGHLVEIEIFRNRSRRVQVDRHRL
ncbi:MAG: AAA family ATPase, partial [Actinobacteria bacterium]|nr:AAA family ATPase [Actinomycetota bacterium]